jgi:hypothetical protein
MLQALQNYDQSEAEQILSRMVLTLLPNPGISESLTTPEEEEIRKKIFAEIVPSGKPLQQALERLSREISELALSNADTREIKGRLGQKGLLPTESYRIGFGPYLKGNSEIFGIRNSHINDAIKWPDLSQHLFPEMFVDSPHLEAFSLFVKTHIAREPADTFSLLVFASRLKAHLEVIDAWLVYHSEVNLSHATTPLDVLQAFTEKYGKPIPKVSLDGVSQKFVLYTRFFLSDYVIANPPYHFFGTHGRPGHSKDERRYWVAHLEANTLDIAFAFVLNIVQYQRDLEKHKHLNRPRK